MPKLLAGKRSGIVKAFPEADHLTMLPKTSVSVQRGKSEAGRKVDTMTERNKVASPTSNPGSDTSPRNKNPRWPAKKKFQQGGILRSRPIVPATDPEFMFKNKYNTQLTPEEKSKYDTWVNEESARQGRDITMDQGAYDIQGFWKSGDYANRDSDGHGSDAWKKPNHPTFSNESRYNGADGFHAGEWGKDGSYFPSKQTRELYGPEYYKRLFGAEPNRPEHLNLSKSTNLSPSIFQEGGKLVPRKEPLNQAQLDSTVQAWRKSPEWYNQASGRAELTDSPIDWAIGGAGIGSLASKIGKGMAASTSPLAQFGSIYPIILGGSLTGMGVFNKADSMFDFKGFNKQRLDEANSNQARKQRQIHGN